MWYYNGMIIRSLIDDDLYKVTMGQLVFHRFNSVHAHYRLIVRSDVKLGYLAPSVQRELELLADLRLTSDESQWLRQLRFVKPDYVDFLENFRHNPRYVTIQNIDDQLVVDIDGPWLFTMWFEVKLLAIISELYMAPHYNANADLKEGKDRLMEKVRVIREEAPEGWKFADFGTRRRFSHRTQEMVVSTFAKEVPQNFVGTSNMSLACKYNLTPIGTMAHEILMAGQAMECQLAESQNYILMAWAQEYRGDLGYALPDTIGLEAFLRGFDMFFAKLYDGVRLDSGDPYWAGEKIIAHYESMRINPLSKVIIPSDDLNLEKSFALHRHFSPRIGVSSGIGTYLTNDCGVKPLSIVIKATHFNGKPVAKISDTPGKEICDDPMFLAYLKQVFKVS
jgi:nicotinate phosphoribosyltransferase